MKTRILLIMQWFDPEPMYKGLAFAQELIKNGFEVEVLTGFPNYPGGKIYPGYKITWLQREVIEGVQVTRVPLYPNHDQSVMKRILNYLSFATSAFIYGLFFAKQPNVIYAYHPPLTVGITACLLRLIRNIPVVYDIQDMWPDTLHATGMLSNVRLLSVVGAVCNWVYRRTDRIIVLSPGFKRLLVMRGVPEEKIDVIYNWADENTLNAPNSNFKSDFSSNEVFKIMFAGNMGKAQALDTVLDAAAILKEIGSRVCFVMLGGGVELKGLRARATEMDLQNMIFLPAVPMAEVGAYLKAADVLLVHLRKDPLFEITIPSKTQAYMAVGKPILMAVDGDAANLVRTAQCGLVSKSEDALELAKVAEKFSQMNRQELDILANNGKIYYKSKLALPVGVRNFARVFSIVISK